MAGFNDGQWKLHEKKQLLINLDIKQAKPIIFMFMILITILISSFIHSFLSSGEESKRQCSIIYFVVHILSRSWSITLIFFFHISAHIVSYKNDAMEREMTMNEGHSIFEITSKSDSCLHPPSRSILSKFYTIFCGVSSWRHM